MSLFMFYERWLDISFSSRLLLPFPTIKDPPTRPSTTRRLSSWEVPLANSVLHDLACESENGAEVSGVFSFFWFQRSSRRLTETGLAGPCVQHAVRAGVVR